MFLARRRRRQRHQRSKSLSTCDVNDQNITQHEHDDDHCEDPASAALLTISHAKREKQTSLTHFFRSPFRSLAFTLRGVAVRTNPARAIKIKFTHTLPRTNKKKILRESKRRNRRKIHDRARSSTHFFSLLQLIVFVRFHTVWRAESLNCCYRVFEELEEELHNPARIHLERRT